MPRCRVHTLSPWPWLSTHPVASVPERPRVAQRRSRTVLVAVLSPHTHR